MDYLSVTMWCSRENPNSGAQQCFFETASCHSSQYSFSSYPFYCISFRLFELLLFPALVIAPLFVKSTTGNCNTCTCFNCKPISRWYYCSLIRPHQIESVPLAPPPTVRPWEAPALITTEFATAATVFGTETFCINFDIISWTRNSGSIPP